MDARLLDHLSAFRLQVRACRNVNRTTLQMATELEQLLDETLSTHSPGGTADDNFPHPTTRLAHLNGH